MTDQLELDWSTAEVSDATLSVALSAKPPKEWRGAFQRTVTLLSAGNWEVTLDAKRKSVQITAVRPGDEERVRHLLEAAVLQANATLVSEEELYGGEPEQDEEGEDSGEDEDDAAEPSPDEELTGRFRGFAEESGDDEVGR
jgi:hypothetical protein